MKILKWTVILCVTILLIVTLSACAGGENIPEIPNRQAQLVETHLFSPHLLCGVSTESDLEGNFQAGFNLLFGTANGEISSTEVMVLKLQNKDGRQYFASIPRSMIVLNQNSEQTEPTVVLEFKESWMNDETSIIEVNQDGGYIEIETKSYVSYGSRHTYSIYSKGAIKSPNNFIVKDNLDAVTINYPTTKINSTCWTQP